MLGLFETMHKDIQSKISSLIADLSAGKISNEQFELVYGRYRYRLAAAEKSLDDEGPQVNTFNTGDLLQGMQARPVGLSLYHHGSGMTLETQGQFDLPLYITAPTLNDLSLNVEWRVFTDPVITKLGAYAWVAFITRHYTTLMVVYRNEPSRLQMRQMERLQHDFEETNKQALSRSMVNSCQLVKPFKDLIQEQPCFAFSKMTLAYTYSFQ
jgi:hypothetical protein